MKKVLVLSLFVVFSFAFLNKNVFAGGSICYNGVPTSATCPLGDSYCYLFPNNDKISRDDIDFTWDSCSNNNPVCGNGIEEGEEQCDDGNDNDMDGCTSECTQCSVDFEGIGGGPAPCVQTDDNDDSTSEEKQGDFRVYLKTYDCNGNELSKVKDSKVKLYNKKGKKVDSDKTNSKGIANFYDVEEGSYKVKCEVDGFISMKDKSKTSYESGYEKVKDGKRATETCHLVQAGCKTNSNSKLAVTGGSFWSYLWELVF